jgi:hypothetical protein
VHLCTKIKPCLEPTDLSSLSSPANVKKSQSKSGYSRTGLGPRSNGMTVGQMGSKSYSLRSDSPHQSPTSEAPISPNPASPTSPQDPSDAKSAAARAAEVFAAPLLAPTHQHC